MCALRVVRNQSAENVAAASTCADVSLYGLPNCDTCRKAKNWLDRNRIDYRFVDYHAEPVASERLSDWAGQLGGWERLINRASTTWRQLPEARKSPGTSAEWIVLLRDHPTLIKRPVLVTADGQVSVGFKDVLFASRLDVGSR